MQRIARTNMSSGIKLKFEINYELMTSDDFTMFQIYGYDFMNFHQ